MSKEGKEGGHTDSAESHPGAGGGPPPVRVPLGTCTSSPPHPEGLNQWEGPPSPSSPELALFFSGC